MIITKERISFIAVWISIVIFLFAPCVRAQQSMDMMSCSDAKVSMLVESKELTIMGIDGRGINLDNLASKVFDNMTFHTVGFYKIEGGKWSGTLLIKYMEPSGDFFVVEVLQAGMERDWKFLYGVGKWSGVTGGGKAFPFTKGKPIMPGSSQGCTKITGSYVLK